MMYGLSDLFTSHYVPIKSAFHSVHLCILVAFTSHYVPIKSSVANANITVNRVFTSHYVPIKSYSQSMQLRKSAFTSHYVPIKSHTNIILYFLPFSTHFLSTTAKTSQADVRNLLNYLLTTLLTPHESMDCQLPHKNALS